MWDSYTRGKNTGRNDGTMGGTLGAMDYNRDKQAREADNNAAVHREAERRREAQRRKASSWDTEKKTTVAQGSAPSFTGRA